jgi:hypothetical protein
MMGWEMADTRADFMFSRKISRFCWWNRSSSKGSRAKPRTTRMLLKTSLRRCRRRLEASMFRWLILRMRWLSFLMGSTTRGPAMKSVRVSRQFRYIT